LMAEMKKVKGKDLTNDELAVMMKDAGKEEAAKKIKKCISSATSLTARKACNTNADAKAAFAKAMGKDAKDITDADLREAGKSQAAKDARDTWSQCIDAAADAAAKKACAKGSDLKAAIANSGGADSADIKDSKVRQYLAAQGRTEKLDFVKSCDKSDATKAAKCKELLKTMKAKDLGKAAGDISDDEIQKDIKAAMGKDISQRMKACIEEAAKDATKIAACRTSMTAAIKDASLDGKAPSATQLQRVLQEGATAQAKDVMQNCKKSRAECFDLVQEAAAKALGKGDKSKVSRRATEVMMKKGADMAAKDSVKACAEAKKEDASATCDDAYTKFLEARGKTKPSNADSAKREKAQVMMGVQKQAIKDNLKVCAEKADNAAFTTCMQAFKAGQDELASTAFSGASTAKLTAKKKVAEMESKVEFIGSEFDACMTAATTDTEKTACKTAMAALKTKLGVKGDDSALKKKFNSKAISEGVLACDSANRKECMKDAKANFKAMGNKEREFDVQKKMGTIKAAADAWAACSDEGVADATCDGEAKTVFMAASDSDGANWASKILPKVKALAKGLKEGKEVEVKKLKSLAVDANTDETVCADATGTKVVDAVKKVATTPAITTAKAQGCVKASGTAAYSTAVDGAAMTDAQREAAADKIAAGITLARRLMGRRLLAVTSVGAAVDSEMCAAGDTSCGQEVFATASTTKKSALTAGAVSQASTALGLLLVVAMLA